MASSGSVVGSGSPKRWRAKYASDSTTTTRVQFAHQRFEFGARIGDAASHEGCFEERQMEGGFEMAPASRATPTPGLRLGG
jgi:hypothetical protein